MTAVEKLPFQSVRTSTHAPTAWAISRLRSSLPPSSTIISSTQRKLSRHAANFRSSFLTIRTAEMVCLGCVAVRDTDTVINNLPNWAQQASHHGSPATDQ